MAVQSTLSTRAEELNFLVHDWIPKRKRTVQTLREVADKLMAHHKNVCIAKLTGSSASLVGFVLVAVGFGLSFVTFGSSLILSAVGGGICAAGGLTTAGSSITEVCIQKDSYKTAQKIFDEDREAMETVENLRGELEEEAKEGGEASFRGLSAAGRVAHVGGFAFSAVLLPLDIYTLVTSAREIDAGNSIKRDFAHNDVIDKAIEYSITFHVICKRYLVIFIERVSLYLVNYCITAVQITKLRSCIAFTLVYISEGKI